MTERRPGCVHERPKIRVKSDDRRAFRAVSDCPARKRRAQGRLAANQAAYRYQETSGVNMNTADIAGVVAAEQGLDKAAAKRVIDATLKAITDAAIKGEEVSLPGFGKFKVQDRPAREGRNPATGATLTIAASRKVSFTPAKALKDSLNG
ncbi:HU family DNA-binding protein [Sphingomonas sp. YR710]|uniref:HU family DNA-binding protein n=1 Tax=Sphingomonas sp. YR710 TaxID=1882773 RepID=UPI0021095EDF|nr:HU family DNA-binding protein [Sphingomonas sp. YR710]